MADDSPLDAILEDTELAVGAPEMAWAHVWQIPVLLLGVGLLAVGVYFALPDHTPRELDAELARIDAQIQANHLSEAEANLKTLHGDQEFFDLAADPTEGYFWQLYADLRFRQIDERVWQGITTEAGQENLGRIAEHYRQALMLERELPSIAQWRFAQTLAAMGDAAGALEVVDGMPMESATRRHEIVRSLVERAVATEESPSSEQVAQLLERFEEEIGNEPNTARRRQERIWLMVLRAERLLRAGDEQAVIAMLVEGGLMRLRHAGATDLELVPLNVVLGEAYTMERSFVDARQRLNVARATIEASRESGSDLLPRVLVGFADIELAESTPGYIERAYGLYNQAHRISPQGPVSIDALIGEAHTEAYRDGRFVEALAAFGEAASRLLTEQARQSDPRRMELEHYLSVHIDREFDSGAYQNALDLLEVAEPLMQDGRNATLVRQFAETYRKLGEESLAQAAKLGPDPNRPGDDPHLEARRIHNQDAARHFEKAARSYRRVATLLEDQTDEHGEALWSAAENYAKSQLWDEAVAVYLDYLDMHGDEERREEAMFRLGQAYLADGQYGAARDYLGRLIDASASSQWAMRSYVPLSRAMVAVDDWDPAERLLRGVVEDHVAIGPDSDYYRDALIELGTLYYRRGTQNDAFYARAIEVLGEEGGAVERYATQDENSTAGAGQYMPELAPKLRYMLADCLRLSALGLGQQAADTPNQNERLAMQAERVTRLRRAQILFNQVQNDLDGRHPDSLSRLEKVYHRNAYFYQADCLYERSDFAGSIPLYQDAAARWREHPSALVAWVQVVNAAAEMGDFERARDAHRQAVEVFNKLPDDAFDRPDSLMTRQRWDDWLRWSTELDLYPDGTATAGVETGN